MKDARNTKRTSDLNTIKKSFDMFKAEGGIVQCIEPYCACLNYSICDDGLPGSQRGFSLDDDLFDPSSENHAYFIVAKKIFVKGSASKWPNEYLAGKAFPKDPNGNPYGILIRDDQFPAPLTATFELMSDQTIDEGKDIIIKDQWKY